MFGASPEVSRHLREIAQHTFTPPAAESRGLLSRLGPIFRRPPATPVISQTQPEPQDVEVLLAGAYVPPDRMGATWRLLETLVQGIAWGAETTFASTWKNGAPGQATVSQLPPALASALEGQTVGSQVLVVVPADQTAQDQQILKAPANAALVYVIDVLGTVS